MKDLGEFVIMLIGIAITSLISAFVIFKLWAWIIEPVFLLHGITFGDAIGLAVIVAFLKVRRAKIDHEETVPNAVAKSIAWSIAMGLFFLLLGWISSLFIYS